MNATLGRRRFRGGQTMLHLTLIVAAAGCVVPLLWTLSASLQTDQQIYSGLHFVPHGFHWSNFSQAWHEAKFSTYFFNTVVYTAAVTVGTLVLGSAAGYAFARLRFPLQRVVYYSFLAFLAFPIPGVFIPLYVLLVRLHLVNTAVGYILPMINVNLPVAIFLFRGFFQQIPRSVEEAAMIDGSTRFQIFRGIALPLARPAIGTVSILTALSVWNEFLLALVVFSDQSKMPLQVGLMTFQGTFFSRYSLMMAATTITMGPALLLYAFFQKSIIKGVMAGAVRG
jgi:ABC-type glycerol-3-phosphate transport system permease component